MNKFISIIVMLSIATQTSFSQSNNFYYLLNDQKELLTKINGKYVVTFSEPVSSTSPLITQNILTDKLFGNTYHTLSPNAVAEHASNYFIHQAYLTNNGQEIFYNKYLVLKFKKNVSQINKTTLIISFNLTFNKSSLSFERYETNNDPLLVSKQIYESGLVEYCTPDFYADIKQTAYIPNDEYFVKQWYLHNTGQGANDGNTTTPDADIDAPEAWDISKGDSSITIAVIDAGITANHPDLPITRQIRLSGSNFDAFSNPISLYPDDPAPDTTTLITGTDPAHGNACAGIIAATQDNSVGVTGIAPLCKIMPIRIPFSSVSSSVFWSIAVASLDFAVLNGANIVSNSWGGTGTQPAMLVSMQNAIDSNVLLVYAAGNNANHLFNISGYVKMPGFYNIDGAIVVGASDKNDHWANYSPKGIAMDIVAPSNTDFGDIPNEVHNIWTIDNPWTTGYNPFNITGFTLPPYLEQLPNTGATPLWYTGRFGGTSASAPQVAGVSALMLSVNKCLSPIQLQDILQSTTDKIDTFNYYWDYTKPGHSQEFGYGKVNAFKAVQGAQKAYSATLDLFTKDNVNDIGLVDTFGTGGGGDKSPDIWVRNQQDGFTNQFHQAPEYSSSSPVYVYIRVRNKSCVPSTGTETVSLNWSQASSWSSWPQNWDGTQPTVGNFVGTATIPVIQPGGSAIVMIPWTLINPNINNNWNSCLLSRISDGNPITIYPNQLNLDIIENNNISILNLTIVDSIPLLVSSSTPQVNQVLLGNILTASEVIDVHIDVPRNGNGHVHDITHEAEVTIKFDALGWDIFTASGQFNQSGIRVMPNQTIMITEPHITLSNVTFPANTRVPLQFKFHFLIDEQTYENTYELTLSQALNSNPEEILGTENFVIKKAQRSGFNANAGNDRMVMPNEPTTLEAEDINESATYNWYNEADSLVFTGRFFSLATTTNQKFRLEVISNLDGFKDDDHVRVNVHNNFIQSISPNPSSTNAVVQYSLNPSATSASLLITKPFTNIAVLIPLNVSLQTQTIDVSNLSNGVYNVILKVDNENEDATAIQIIH